MKLDVIDGRILDILQSDAKITNAQLAAEVGISASGMLDRVKRLETAGVIKKHVTLVDPEKVGSGTFALVAVSLAVHKMNSIEHFVERIEAIPEILECYHVTGEDDYILKVAVAGIKDYESSVLKELTKIDGINKIKTTFVLSTVKYNTRIKVQNIIEK